MASKRIASSAVNWSAIAERVHPEQRINFNNFKVRSDKYLRSVQANPESSPKIDWAFYKSRVAVPGLVDNFQKSYEALKVAYPKDNLSASVDNQAKEVKSEIEQFKQASKSRIVSHQEAIDHLKSLLPFDQMTMEDYREAYPDLALDPINRPTFWPHTPEEQLDYKPEGPGGAAPPSAH